MLQSVLFLLLENSTKDLFKNVSVFLFCSVNIAYLYLVYMLVYVMCVSFSSAYLSAVLTKKTFNNNYNNTLILHNNFINAINVILL